MHGTVTGINLPDALLLKYRPASQDLRPTPDMVRDTARDRWDGTGGSGPHLTLLFRHKPDPKFSPNGSDFIHLRRFRPRKLRSTTLKKHLYAGRGYTHEHF